MRLPWKRRGTRAASTHFVKVQGDNAMPNGRTRFWYALPPKANLRNLLWHGRMNMWKYASLRSIVTNQSSDLICGTICLKVKIMNLICKTESFRTRSSKMGCNPILLWNYEIPSVNTFSLLEWGTYSMAPFSNRAFTSCSITRTCWGATLGGKHPHKSFFIVCRTQPDILPEVSTLSNLY